MSVEDNHIEGEEGKVEPISQQRVDSEEQVEWIEKYDETYNLYYYLNTISGECQWDSPFGETVDDGEHQSSPLGKTGDEKEPQEGEHEQFAYYAHEHQYIDDVDQSYYNNEGEDMETHQHELHRSHQHHSDAWQVHEERPTYYQQEDFVHEQQQEFPFDYDSDEAGDQYEHYDYEPYDEEAAPKSVKNRSKDLLVGGSNQDYVHMARMYKLTRPYSDPNYTGLCVLCHTNFADVVFFPCEHRCVCSECVQQEHICSDIQMESIRDGYCNCSLCAGIIKLILPSEGGAEVHKYWNWVYEETVPLPSNLLRNFRHSAAVIRAVHVRNGDSKNVDSFENASKSCCVS